MRVDQADQAMRRPLDAGDARRPPLRATAALAVAAMILAVPLAACQTDGGPAGRTLAFESIDGPPQPTFEKLVGGLSSEAQARRMAVVSRNQNAAYRVKGYLAMHVDKGQASVAYTWDVYDADRSRVVRIAGEEPAGPVKGKAGWAAADEAVLARIAEKSMTSLAEAFGGSARAPAVAAAEAPAAEPASATATAAEAAPATSGAAASGALSYAAQ